jgi:hypothetical protein
MTVVKVLVPGYVDVTAKVNVTGYNHAVYAVFDFVF